MVRQCAWCLCLINSAGERLSPLPLPKLYEASHGICGICGIQWMEQVINADEPQGTQRPYDVDLVSANEFHDIGSREAITQLVLQLQQDRTSEHTPDTPPKTRRSTRMRIN
jgi:hypothetical protein